MNKFIKIALYFILFEFSFWTSLKSFGISFYTLILYGDIIRVGYIVLLSLKVLLSFLLIILSLLFFALFIKYLVEEIKDEHQA